MPTEILCPIDHLPLPALDAIQDITFPDDAERVLDLVLGNLNAVIHKVCHKPISIQPATWVVHAERNQILVSGLTADELEQIIRSETEKRGAARATVGRVRRKVHACADYTELAATVKEWLHEYFRRAIASLFTGGAQPAAKDGMKSYQHPLVLLSLKAQADGRLGVVVQADPPPPPEDQRRFVAQLLDQLVQKFVAESYTFAFHHGGIATLLDLVEQRIPTECITQAVLTSLVEQCVDWDPSMIQSPSGLDAPFRPEYINAVAHAVTGVANPREEAWAEYMLALFVLSQSEAVSCLSHSC